MPMRRSTEALGGRLALQLQTEFSEEYFGSIEVIDNEAEIVHSQ